MNFSYWFGHRVFRELALGLFDYRVVGAEKLQFSGPAIIACNHVSFLDPPLVGIAFDEMVYSFARKTLFNHPLAAKILRSWQVLAVDRDKPDAASLKNIIRLLRDGNKVIMFPEGTRAPRGKKGTYQTAGTRLAVQSGAPVVPIAVATARCWPKEGFVKRGGVATVSIGPLIESKGRDPKALMREAEAWIEAELRRIDPQAYQLDAPVVTTH